MKNRRTAVVLVLLLAALAVTACSGSDNPSDTAAAPAPAPAETEQTAVLLTAEEKLEAAKGFLDQPVEDLIAKIGEPDSRDYAPSCFGDGEDGNLYYEGFTVYTYRENGKEVVRDVE